MSSLAINEDEAGITIRVRLQPRASRSGLAGLHGDALKVRVTAPPVDGMANKALCALLADLLDVVPGRVTIQSGHKGRDKLVRVEGRKASDVEALLKG